MSAYCEQQDLSVRQRRVRFDKQQSATQTHLPSWKWRTKIRLTCPAADMRCLLYPGVLWQTKNTFSTREPQFGPATSCDYNTPRLSILLLDTKWMICEHTCRVFSVNLLANVPVGLASGGDVLWGSASPMKTSPFSLRGMFI